VVGFIEGMGGSDGDRGACAMVNSSKGNYGEPEDAAYVPGVDYVSGWRMAAEAADEVNGALRAMGVDEGAVRAVPHSGAHGEPVVWLRPEDARLIARVLRQAR
jgi:hypothetical protein